MKRPLLMIVDDDDDEVAIALRALGRAGMPVEVLTVASGSEALAALRVNGQADGASLPQVIFLDLRMPQIDGFEVLECLRRTEHTRKIPVVVVSSSDRPEDIRRSYELGANSYVVKRFDPDEPGRYMVQAARYWLELNETT